MAGTLESDVIRRGGDRHWWLWSGIALMNVFMIGVVAFVIVQNRQRAFDEARAIAENYSRTIEENFVGFIRRIDVTLLTVADEVTRQRANGGIKKKELNAFLARQDTHIAEARGLRVIDEQGTIRYAMSGINVRGANLGDRPYFIRVRDDPNAGLVFSEPVMGRASTMPVITLSRRISDPDGAFAGEVNAAVAIDRFTSMLSLLELGRKGSVSLWSKTQLIARYTKDNAADVKTGTPIPSLEMRSLIESGRKADWYHLVTSLDNVERIYQFRQIGVYPLYVVIGLADDDFLAEWRSDSIRVAGLAVVFVVSTMLFALLTHLGLRRREQMEAALRESETFLNTLLDAIPIPVFYKDRGGRYLGFNSAYETFLGATRDRLIGKTAFDISPRELAEIYSVKDNELFESGGIQQYESQVRNAHGVLRDIIFNKAVFTDSQGNIAGLIGAILDISERKQAEEQLRSLNQTLERRVAEETKKNVEQERILTLQARHAAMGEMVGNIAHQWRQPLAVLGLVIQNLHYDFKDGRLDEKDLEEYVANALRAIEQMTNTIDDFRDFFRPTHQAVNFSVVKVTEDCLALVDASLRNNGIEASVTGTRKVELLGFPSEFSQIMLNLIANAKDVLLERKIAAGRIEIEVTSLDGRVVVTVRDNAGGITPENLEKIFDPYFTTKEGGTGIGLYIASTIVEQHMHGAIKAGNWREGAEFSLTLPQAHGPKAVAA